MGEVQMKKTTSFSFVLLLLLSLLALSTPQLIGIKTAKASETSMIWGSMEGQPYEETIAAADVCNYIEDKFQTYMGYNWVNEKYGGGTTKSYVESCTIMCNSYFDNSVVFYTGHGWPEHPIDGQYHYHVYPNVSRYWEDGIQDVSIQQRTTEETHYFVFLWACFQGNEIGYYDETGAVGMPYAWTQQDDLNLDGYHNNDGTPHCFIGFKHTSPPLHYDAGGLYDYEYGNFVKYFYYHATYHHSTIHKALNDASLWVWGKDFDKSVLWNKFWWYNPAPPPQGGWQYGWMKVYGNSWNTLPY
jgi:hypothetical protein